MQPLISAALVLGFVAISNAQSSHEASYLDETSRAMEKMMADMNIPPTGDVDSDFVAMMVPHHRGAIEMAQAELRHGRNELLRRIAQGIVVAQLQEIEAMRLALNTIPEPSAGPPGPSMPSMALSPRHHHAN